MPESFSLWYRVTLGLRKIDGRWLVTHEHESVPFEMDGSFRASVDLLP
jgi:ketosteroid isomerase-like protein